MDLEDFLVSNNILPLGSVVYLLFCTHKNGWGWNNFIREANCGQGLKIPAVRGYMTYVLPWIVVIIYLKGYYVYVQYTKHDYFCDMDDYSGSVPRNDTVCYG